MIKFYGNNAFMNNPLINEVDPSNKHSKFSENESSTVFIDFPPYFTIVNWMRIVPTKMIKKRGLLKKF